MKSIIASSPRSKSIRSGSRCQKTLLVDPATPYILDHFYTRIIYLVGKQYLRYYTGNAIMVVSFKNKKEEDLYQSEKALKAVFGARVARKIIQQIGHLQAADTPQQLPASARFHEHSGKRKGLYSVDLIHPFRLIVEPTCEYVSWVKITSVKIIEVMDPH